VKGKIIFGSLLVSLMLLVVACNNPDANESSIQVVNQYNHCCPIYVNLDGGTQETITGTSYTFQNIAPGNHTLNFTTNTTTSGCSGNSGATGSGCTSSSCQFGNNSTSQSVNFNTSAGYEYNATLQAVSPGNCGTITINTAGL
jgi:hypothetical protein